MSTFDWVELETLSTEFAHLQSRLDAARDTRNLGLVQLLERELADAEKKRDQVLADITKGLSAISSANRQHIPLKNVLSKPAEGKRSQSGNVEPGTLNSVPSAARVLATDTATGDTSMWDQLTAADIERVKRGLATRRSEILARHAEELKAFEADQNEIDAIEKAIAVFTQKFKLASTAEVIPLEGERVPVQAR